MVKDLQLVGNLFDPQAVDAIIQRINKLCATSLPIWGKMSVSQMLAHCNVTYTLIYDAFSPKPNFMKKALLKLFLKPIFTSPRPYKKNSFWTPSEFRVREQGIFWFEKIRLINFILVTQELGACYFDQKESILFGVLTKEQWNNMFYKHLDHHLRQFGV